MQALSPTLGHHIRLLHRSSRIIIMLPAALAAAGAGLRRAVAELGRAGLLRSHQAQAVASLTILAE